MKKALLLCLCLAVFAPRAAAQLNMTSDFTGLNLSAKTIVMPLMSGDFLSYVVYFKELMPMSDNSAEAVATVIDIIGKDYDPEAIPPEPPEIYVITAPVVEVAKFWIDYKQSSGLIVTDRALFNPDRQTAEGASIAQLRSPLLDIDGIGFVANLEDKNVSIKQNVHIVLRMGGEPLEEALRAGDLAAIEADPELQRTADIWCDQAVFDFGNGVVSLIGDVIMTEGNSEIRSDFVEIILATSEGVDSTAPYSASGVRQVNFRGNVVLTSNRNSATPDVVSADFVSYDLQEGRIELEGDMPAIRSGSNSISGRHITIMRDAQTLEVRDDCLLTLEIADAATGGDRYTRIKSDFMFFDYAGNHAEALRNVRINDPRGMLLTHKLTATLSAGENTDKPVTSIAGVGGVGFTAGNKQVETIDCSGGVRLFGTDNEEGESEELHYNYRTGIITLHGGTPWVRQGGNRIDGKSISLEQASNRLMVSENARAVFVRQERVGAAEPVITVVTADLMDLDYNNDLCVLTGNVHINDTLADVNCSKMTIYLVPQKRVTPQEFDPVRPFSTQGGGKTIGKILCEGEVVAMDPRGKLESDILTLHLHERDSGTDLKTADAQGNVAIRVDSTSLSDEALTELAGGAEQEARPTLITADRAVLDMEDNSADLTGNVRVDDSRVKTSSDRLQIAMKEVSTGEPVVTRPVFESPEMEFEPFVAGNIPEHISVGEGRQLTEVVLSNKVVITGADESAGAFIAKGERAVYDVVGRRMTMPTENSVRPTLSQGGRVTENDEVWIDLAGSAPVVHGRGGRITQWRD